MLFVGLIASLLMAVSEGEFEDKSVLLATESEEERVRLGKLVEKGGVAEAVAASMLESEGELLSVVVEEGLAVNVTDWVTLCVSNGVIVTEDVPEAVSERELEGVIERE